MYHQLQEGHVRIGKKLFHVVQQIHAAIASGWLEWDLCIHAGAKVSVDIDAQSLLCLLLEEATKENLVSPQKIFIVQVLFLLL